MICSLGDLLLDVIVRLDGPIAGDTDTYGRTSVGPGGQAANVAAWTAELGGRSRLLARRAEDTAGRLLGEEMERRGVELAGPIAAGSTGTVVSIASPDARRTMLTDRGVCPDFAPADLDAAWLGGCESLHVPGYSLAVEPIRATSLAAVGAARGAGARISVDLSSAALLAESGSDLRHLVAEIEPDVVFANEAEAELFGRIDAPTVVVKRGARGCSVHTRAETLDYPAEQVEVVDTTGAGDAFAAGFLLRGAEAGLAAAARCISSMGAMP
ncbi:MAG TPA: carbohydrate kinase family protein [Gaiellaceae bacterium]